MDIQMPLLDGFQATERIRQSEAQKVAASPPSSDSQLPIPIIAISASLEEPCKDEYSRKGVDGWMLKPVNFRRLDMMVRGIHDTGLRDIFLSSEVTWGQGGWLTT
jgi:CheY-like chemotaxis protein